MTSSKANRPLSRSELSLARWMLERGEPEARAFLSQLEEAEVMPTRCVCGCGSIDFQIRGRPLAPKGVHPIAEFLFGEGEGLCGIFLFESGGILKGLEVYGLAGAAPATLPREEQLRSFGV